MSNSVRGSDFPSVTIPYLVWLGAVAGGTAGLLESLAMLVRGGGLGRDAALPGLGGESRAGGAAQ